MRHTLTKKSMDRVVVRAGGLEYPVLVGAGCASELLAMLPPESCAAALICDSNLERLHAPKVRDHVRAALATHTFAFPAGEASKTRAVKESLEDRMFEKRLGRDSVIIAVGGGVTLDLAGFVASTYMRGVPWLAVPTSLLAAVDAGVGGKVAVNVPAGKNLIGSFHQPAAVCVDLELLGTLPAEEVDNGLSEMVKHAVIADAVYLDLLLSRTAELRRLDADALHEPVLRSVEIKARVVNADPTENDLRQVLNFGHTIGHAIEKLSHFAVAHGRAVAIGMSVEAGLATRLGILGARERDQLRAALVSLDLPVRPPPQLSDEDVVAATAADKKGRRGQARYVLPSAIGKVEPSEEGYARSVAGEEVRAALAEARACSV